LSLVTRARRGSPTRMLQIKKGCCRSAFSWVGSGLHQAGVRSARALPGGGSALGMCKSWSFLQKKWPCSVRHNGRGGVLPRSTACPRAVGSLQDRTVEWAGSQRPDMMSVHAFMRAAFSTRYSRACTVCTSYDDDLGRFPAPAVSWALFLHSALHCRLEYAEALGEGSCRSL
jgi:hypothetical protein